MSDQSSPVEQEAAANPRAVIGNNRPPPEDLLAGYASQADIARMFGVTDRCIRNWTTMPDGIPFLDLGRRRHYPIERCKEWLASRVRQQNPTRRKGR